MSYASFKSSETQLTAEDLQRERGGVMKGEWIYRGQFSRNGAVWIRQQHSITGRWREISPNGSIKYLGRKKR